MKKSSFGQKAGECSIKFMHKKLAAESTVHIDLDWVDSVLKRYTNKYAFCGSYFKY